MAGRSNAQVPAQVITYHPAIKVGAVFCGRQSLGGPSVIWGLHEALKACNPKSDLLVFLRGTEGLFDNRMYITDVDLANEGVHVLLGTTTQIRISDHINDALKTCEDSKLDGLVVIGGVTSSTEAAELTETFAKANCRTKVQFVEANDGFDIICKLISNVCTDALSAEKCDCFIRLMGHKASHVALECTNQSHPNMVDLRRKPVAPNRILTDIPKFICDSVLSRWYLPDKHHGVVLLPEGLTENFPKAHALLQEIHGFYKKGASADSISPKLPRWASGLPPLILKQIWSELVDSVQLSQIQFEKLLAHLVEGLMNKRMGTAIRVRVEFGEEFGDVTTAADPDPVVAHTINRYFPHTYAQPLPHPRSNAQVPDAQVITYHPDIKVGAVLCGRQSLEGHNVIWGLHEALKACNSQSKLLVFLGAFDDILSITDEVLAKNGGHDLLGTKTKGHIRITEQINDALETCKTEKLDGLVVIEGVTSSIDAAELTETFANCRTKVQFVKAYDGFDTIAKCISNVCTDALSAQKVLREEFPSSKLINKICNEVQDGFLPDKYHEDIPLPEGLIERIPEVYALSQSIHDLLKHFVSASISSPWASALLKFLPPFIQKILLDSESDDSVQLSHAQLDQILLDSESDDSVQLSHAQLDLVETKKLLAPLVQVELSRQMGTAVQVEFGVRTTVADPVGAHTINCYFPQVITYHPPIKVGVVFCGRLSLGGYNVIWGLHEALKVCNPKSDLFGFLCGTEGLFDNNFVYITDEVLASEGDYDLLGTTEKGQKNITEQIYNALKTCKALKLDALVVIGGLHINYDAADLAETFAKDKCHTKVVGVPVTQTPNGDPKDQFVEANVGFDTICSLISCTDAHSAEDVCYYFIRLMGPKASQVAPEATLQSHPNMVVLAEDLASSKLPLLEIINKICDKVQDRSLHGMYHGVILLPEDLIESIFDVYASLQEFYNVVSTADSIFSQLSPWASALLDFLPPPIRKQILHPESDASVQIHLQLSRIQSEKLLAHLVEVEMNGRTKKGTGKRKKLWRFIGCQARGSLPDCDFAYPAIHSLVPVRGPIGLLNVNKNTCYLNVIFQMALAVQYVREHIVSKEHFDKDLDEVLVCLERILMHTGETVCCAHYDLVLSFKGRAEFEQDYGYAHDSLQAVLSSITHSEWVKETFGCDVVSKCRICQRDPSIETSWWILLDDNETEEPRQTLMELLLIPKLKLCINCGKLTLWDVSYKRLPKALIIRTDGTRIDFPERFDIGRCLLNQKSVMYDIKAVVAYTGDDELEATGDDELEAGHFYAYVKCQQKWFTLDDHKVSNATWEEIHNCSLYSPVLIMYERDDGIA